MRIDKIVLSLGVITLVLAMLLTTGVAYAFETGNIIKINDKPTSTLGVEGFNVAFLNDVKTTGDGKITVKITGDTTASVDITGLKNVGDSATAIFTIENSSRDFAAELNAFVENSNTEYFRATVLPSEDVIEAKFGALYKAFQFGAPPHAGVAPGVDRMIMLLTESHLIRFCTNIILHKC